VIEGSAPEKESAMNLPPGVHSKTVKTNRLNMRYIDSGPEDGVPVVMIHGNLSTGRFFEHLMPGAPAGYRLIAPDMRGFGDTERKPIDATRGVRDWADDTFSLVQALGITRPVHLVGWSTGGAAIGNYAVDRPVASLTFVDPVSPYGFGGVKLDGTPCFPDYAGSGGGTGNPDFTKRIADHDTSSESPFSPRNVINSSYWAPTHREPTEREDMLVEEVLKSVTGDDGYPGDATPSSNWPTIAPGTRGILNALSPKYCNWSDIVEVDPKPPVLWTHGTADIVVADGSAWEMGTLGKMGVVPGWPGDEAFPPQQMVTQIRNVLERYRDNGGHVQFEMFEGSGHGPLFDAAERWSEIFFAFVTSAETQGAHAGAARTAE
jgi:pimeloyl-ACP methyl ester carboxylesterase